MPERQSPPRSRALILNAVSFRRAFAAILLFAAVATLHAQLPNDNEAWKSRCNLLTAQSTAIQNGATPALLIAATRGVPANDFFVLAVNRAQAGQHFTACTMYFLAAVAARSGNGAKPDPISATNDAIVGGSEQKLANRHHLRMKEHLKRVELKVEEITGKPLTLTPDQTSAALQAAGTMPLSLTPSGT